MFRKPPSTYYFSLFIYKCPKQDALIAINQLQDNVELNEIIYRLYVLNKDNQGMNVIDDENGVPQEELARNIEQ